MKKVRYKMNGKPTIMISFREGGENGGPYVSHRRIMESELKETYNFIPLIIPKGHLGLLNIKVLKFLYNQIKSENPDVIHFTGLQLEGFHVIIACKLARIKKTIIAIHGSSMEAIEISKLKKFILNIVEIVTLKLTYFSYGVSNYVTEWPRVKKYSKRCFGCIYNIPSDKKELLQPNVTIRKELGIDDDEIVIVSTGRITKEKGYETLCNVIKKAKTDSKVRFIIAGDGPYLSEMRQELYEYVKSGKVFLLGYRNDINRILEGSNIFVICSLHETLCISLLEAASNGLALIGSNVGGIPEIIEENKSGYLVQPNNIDQFVHTIEGLANDKNKIQNFGNHAYNYVRKKFDEKEIMKKINELYDKVLNS